MTYFSLKRTLLQYLNSAAESKYKGAENEFIPVLHDSGKPLPTMLRIGKSSIFCHPDIPLKKTHQVESVIYASAISRKLEKNWQHPANGIATDLLNVLKNAQKPLSVRMTLDNWIPLQSLWQKFSIDIREGWMLCFELPPSGIWHWLQRLTELPTMPPLTSPVVPIASADLWQVQYSYSRCASLWYWAQTTGQKRFESDRLVDLGEPQVFWITKPRVLASTPTELLCPEEQALLHRLIEAIDAWEIDAWVLSDQPGQDWILDHNRLSRKVIAIGHGFELCHRRWLLRNLNGLATSSFRLSLIQATGLALSYLGRGVLGWQLSTQL